MFFKNGTTQVSDSLQTIFKSYVNKQVDYERNYIKQNPNSFLSFYLIDELYVMNNQENIDSLVSKLIPEVKKILQH